MIVSERFCGGCCGTMGCLQRWSLIRALYEGFSAQVVHNGQRKEYEDWGKTRLAISTAVSGCPGLGDEDSLWQGENQVATSLEDLDFANYCPQDMRDKTQALEVLAKVGINATKTKLMRIGTKRDDGVSVVGGPMKHIPWEHLLMRTFRRIGKARQAFAMLRPIWRCTNNQDQAENLWVKCEGSALVWFWNLEVD